MGVSIQQRDIPIEFHTEARAGLFLWRGSMTVKHLQINIRMFPKRAKPRRVVLDRMSGDDGNSYRIYLVTLKTANEPTPSISLTPKAWGKY